MTRSEIFEKAIAAYTDSGYPDEWQKHHHGGVASYEPREYLALPGFPEPVTIGQVNAWNPSITGTNLKIPSWLDRFTTIF